MGGLFRDPREPAVSVMAMSLDSHVVNCGSCPGPGGLKHTGHMCVRAQDPERRMEEKGLRCGHPPWGLISHFLSLCLSLSGERTYPIAKTSQKNNNKLNL